MHRRALLKRRYQCTSVAMRSVISLIFKIFVSSLNASVPRSFYLSAKSRQARVGANARSKPNYEAWAVVARSPLRVPRESPRMSTNAGGVSPG